LGDAFSFRRKGPGAFTYRGIHRVWPGMVTGLLGDYQVENAAMVLAACELLLHKAPRISLDSVRAGLLAHRWPGRLEVVSEMPLVMLDGAHNLDAAKQLARHVREHFTGRDITVVVGILDDKPYAAMLRLLLPMASRVVVTQARINRALPAEKIEAVAKKLVADVRIIRDVGEAVGYAVATATPESVVLVAGSLYVVGEAKAALEKRSLHPG
jgi:dihydrofolate synthase/folylpolyglutamate synthase